MTDQRRNRWRDSERIGTEQRRQGAEQHKKWKETDTKGYRARETCRRDTDSSKADRGTEQHRADRGREGQSSEED